MEDSTFVVGAGKTTRRVLIVGLFQVQLGCAGSSLPPADVLITDSAGVVIVEVGPLEAIVAPSVTLERVFRTSQTGVELFRVSSARWLESGQIAVGNSGNQEVLLLDSTGTLDRTIGRDGDGPGEFRAVTSLHRSPRGGFSAYDTRIGRWTHFDRNGELLATEPMSPPSRVVDLAPLSSGPEGGLLAIYGSLRRFAKEGIKRDTTPLLQYRARDDSPDTLSLWATEEWSYAQIGAGTSRTPVGFGRSLAAFGTGEWAVLGDTDRLDISLFDSTGRLSMTIRGGGEPIPISDADGERWRRDMVSRLGSDVPEDFRERFRQAPFRDSYPSFGKVAVDTMGRVWVGTTSLVRATERRWVIFAHDGTPAGTVELPVGADVLDITEDRLLTLEQDGLDVEVVILYAVHGLE